MHIALGLESGNFFLKYVDATVPPEDVTQVRSAIILMEMSKVTETPLISLKLLDYSPSGDPDSISTDIYDLNADKDTEFYIELQNELDDYSKLGLVSTNERFSAVLDYFNTAEIGRIIPKMMMLFDCFVSSPAVINRTIDQVADLKEKTQKLASELWVLMTKTCKPTIASRDAFVNGMMALALTSDLVLAEYKKDYKYTGLSNTEANFRLLRNRSGNIYTQERVRGWFKNKSGLFVNTLKIDVKSEDS